MHDYSLAIDVSIYFHVVNSHEPRGWSCVYMISDSIFRRRPEPIQRTPRRSFSGFGPRNLEGSNSNRFNRFQIISGSRVRRLIYGGRNFIYIPSAPKTRGNATPPAPQWNFHPDCGCTCLTLSAASAGTKFLLLGDVIDRSVSWACTPLPASR